MKRLFVTTAAVMAILFASDAANAIHAHNPPPPPPPPVHHPKGGSIASPSSSPLTTSTTSIAPDGCLNCGH